MWRIQEQERPKEASSAFGSGGRFSVRAGGYHLLNFLVPRRADAPSYSLIARKVKISNSPRICTSKIAASIAQLYLYAPNEPL
jgi:hypothetical protein